MNGLQKAAIIVPAVAFTALCGAGVYRLLKTEHPPKNQFVTEKAPESAPMSPALTTIATEQAEQREKERELAKARENAAIKAAEMKEQAEEARRIKKDRDYLLVNWQQQITADFYGGKWFLLIEGGGFENVSVAAKNDTDYEMDEIRVKFEVKRRLDNKTCFSQEIPFYNVAPHSSKSQLVGAKCGMRPATLGVTYFRCSELNASVKSDDTHTKF